MAAEITSVRLQIKNQKVREDLKEVISSIEGFRLQKMDDPNHGDLLILEISADLQRDFQVMNAIQKSGAVREIFVTSSSADPEILIQALREGVKEFISQPVKREEVHDAFLRFKERQQGLRLGGEKRRRGRIIDVIGSKGGVGTTTVAVNLATSLAEMKASPLVALIDMNLLFGEIPIFLDVKSAFDWGEVARNISRLDSTFLMSILSKHSSGAYVLPSPTGLDGVNLATPEIIEKLLVLMQSVFDFVVIDGGQSLNDISLKILERSDILLPVGVLSLPCLTNLKRLLWTFRELGYPKEENIKIIVNRYHKKSVIPVQEAEKTLNTKIFWLIPNDYPTTMSAINQGKNLSVVAQGAEITKNIMGLASTLSEKEREKEKVGVWRSLK